MEDAQVVAIIAAVLLAATTPGKRTPEEAISGAATLLALAKEHTAPIRGDAN